MSTFHKAKDAIESGMNLAVDNPENNDDDNGNRAEVDAKAVKAVGRKSKNIPSVLIPDTIPKKALKGAAKAAFERKAKRQNANIEATADEKGKVSKKQKGVKPKSKAVEDEEIKDEESSASGANKKKRGRISAGDNDESSSGTPSKLRVIKQPRKPTTALLDYKTTMYTRYDSSQKNAGPAVIGKFQSFAQFNSYALIMDPTITKENFVERVPTSGVRLDDRTAAIALLTMPHRSLRDHWPAEFDTAGMIRATRVPLGHAYKKWVKQGVKDIDGNAVTEPGYYYLWWRGLHCMMGKEGLDAGLYMIRPSFETFKCEGFGFKISHKAVIQHSSGDS